MKAFLNIVLFFLCSVALAAQSSFEGFAQLSDKNTVVLKHEGYASCFSTITNTPLWVAWELTPQKASAQTASRTDEFLPDPLLGERSPLARDYSRSGYDRGHMAPAADFKWSWTAMEESFYMSNICPQNHTLNGEGPWLGLEKQCRAWGKRYPRLYMVAGPLFSKTPKFIGNSCKVAVPRAFYKVILKEFKGHWYAIGFVFPNEEITGEGTFFEYACSVDQIEKLSGIDFFPFLSDEVEERVESQTILADWSYYLIKFAY